VEDVSKECGYFVLLIEIGRASKILALAVFAFQAPMAVQKLL
jgi:hypothetical protein